MKRLKSTVVGVSALEAVMMCLNVKKTVFVNGTDDIVWSTIVVTTLSNCDTLMLTWTVLECVWLVFNCRSLILVGSLTC